MNRFARLKRLSGQYWPTALAVVGLVAVSPGVALAHESVARTEIVTAGPYSVQLGMGQDPPTVETPLDVTAVAAKGAPSLEGATLTLTGKPGLGTDAAVTRGIAMSPEPQEKGSFEAKVGLAVRGNWILQLDISGPAGTGTASLPLVVAAPAAIPTWLGWLIGMAPLLGLAWFAWWNRAYYLRLKREAGVS
ncbi:MAG TPA: hypothetical protein VMU19_00090 [Bryobacteraceae bacterium]|nr:hypothetical protein [Bryobacteraceae bacterium]